MKVFESKPNRPELTVTSVRVVPDCCHRTFIQTRTNEEEIPGADADEKDQAHHAHHVSTHGLLRRRDLLHDPGDKRECDCGNYEDVQDQDQRL